MDFTEKYIKMCEKAEEIQERWKPRDGDFIARVWWNGKWYRKFVGFAKVMGGGTYIEVVPSTYSFDIEEKERSIEKYGYREWIWLPRQDQLQEMCAPPLDILVVEFWQWIPHEQVAVKYTSMEQLWLAFVMWELYGKIWDDGKEEWAERSVSDEKGKDKD